MIKLNDRWQDTLFTFKERIKLLKEIQVEQRRLARQRAHAARTSMMKGSVKYSLQYSLLFNKVRGKVGKKLSSFSVSHGKRHFLLSHYYAKKRVYARRKTARQLARKMGGSKTLMERWKLKYAPGVTLTEPAQQSWFDKEGYPLTSRDPETGRFVNPWLSESTNGETGLKKFLRWKILGPWHRFLDHTGASNESDLCEEARIGINDLSADGEVNGAKDLEQTSQGSPIQTLAGQFYAPYYRGRFFHSAKIEERQKEAINLTWIGHSSTLVKFPGDFTILTDPHFSNYAGPVRRNSPPAFGVSDLPQVVDCVLISHDHMDHLDYWSILELIDSNKVQYWVVPLGIKSWLMDEAGVTPENIIELEWWEGVRMSKATKSNRLNGRNETILPEVEGLVRSFDNDCDRFGKRRGNKGHGSSGKNELLITCAPAQHWCSRTPFDRNRRLWCSFAVQATPHSDPTARPHSFYFAGDTGLPPEFPLHRQIGDRLGPFDLSAIPIGAYAPDWFMRESHCDPSGAVQIHQEVRSKRSVAVHFDTFDLADEPREEPPKLLMNEVAKINKEIAKMAAEVIAAADEVGIATGVGKIGSRLGHDPIEFSSCHDKDLVAKANGQPMLPPLVDFAVINQGESIKSVPK
ncbi:hypothetical protein ACHAWF_003313 [Thalassiosira exigua]